MNVIVSGGTFDDSGDGILWHVDLERGSAETVLLHRPPPGLSVKGKGFTGASWLGPPGQSELLVCGFNAVYRVSASRWEVTGLLHQPCMNDLHHVAVIQGKVYVVNTGLDSVDVFDVAGRFVGSHCTGPAWLQARRLSGVSPSRSDWQGLLDPGWDLRSFEAADSPPRGAYYETRSSVEQPFHQRVVRDYVHPNHIAEVGNRLLCTRLADSRVVDLRTLETVIDDFPGHPHDGVVMGGQVWLTCVGGYVVSFEPSDPPPWPPVHVLDIVATTGRSGWCRGLLVRDDVLVVGLTEIRQASAYFWRDAPFAGTETSVLVIDKSTGRLLQRVDLTDRKRHSKIYSVLPL
ncbi:MAG: hypothetical protein AMXMBFR64_48890 [Myxococcales bacterium]